MAIQIPKQFKLLGQTITVAFEPEYFIEHDSWGYSSYRQNKILIRPISETDPRTDEQTEQVFFHELTHFVLYYAESAYSDNKDLHMHSDEGFVDLVASLYHQAFSTFEF